MEERMIEIKLKFIAGDVEGAQVFLKEGNLDKVIEYLSDIKITVQNLILKIEEDL